MNTLSEVIDQTELLCSRLEELATRDNWALDVEVYLEKMSWETFKIAKDLKYLQDKFGG